MMLPEDEVGLPGKFGLMAGKNSSEVIIEEFAPLLGFVFFQTEAYVPFNYC